MIYPDRKLMSRTRQLLFIMSYSLMFSAFVVAKVFLVKGCWAFDLADDANHTFPNLFLSRWALGQGLLPEINFFNNFGSPILGDALTYPFALHSVTYWFFLAPIAMTLNRAVFAGMTIFLGFLFFQRRLPSRISLLVTTMVFVTPVSLWYFATYHMQLALFFEFLLLVAIDQDAADSEQTLPRLAIAATLMLLSLSINLSVFIMVAVLASEAARTKFRGGLRLARIAIAFAGASVATSFQTYAFVKAIGRSSRLANHYDDRGAYSVSKLIARILRYVPEAEQAWHTDATVYLGFPVLALSALGLFHLYHRKRADFRVAVFAGLAPVAFSYVLMTVPSVWWTLPLVKSTDLTRIIWLALPFLFIAVGSGAQVLVEHIGRGTRMAFAALCGVLVLTQGTSVRRIMGMKGIRTCRNTHHYSMVEDASARPTGLLDDLPPGSRFTFEEPTVIGNDFRGIYKGLLGSYQRAITSDQRLLSYLSARNLIEIEPDPNKTYHFKAPWRADQMDALGIRYIVLSAPLSREQDGWSLVRTLGGKYLYENQRKSSPIYLAERDGRTPIHGLRIGPNTIEADLPLRDTPSTLIATFVHAAAYVARIDDVPVVVRKADDSPFMVIDAPAGAKHLTLRYEDMRWSQVYACLFLGFTIVGLGTILLRRRRPLAATE